MAIMSVLAGCFHPPSEAARGARSQQRKAERRRYEAEKRRWVEEQVALHLAAMYTYDGGRGGSVDVSRYGGINLELALSYEFDRRWKFARITRLLAQADGMMSGGAVKVHPLAAAEQIEAGRAGGEKP
ncbi:uncharacterized protein LOC121055802 [Oryza brachyantha]|uniref:uncharacterized protein LOC121055802 n=1 Tax=Oryza brachyantha TaxID=4533 RepID=UPI001ADCE66B|nr:uncharacterized protein LOC121055802 [Oryza brachyantha]XP_040385024.1 uncharacterized protein LOC121055802 [Oryza brachyantha]